MRITLQLPAFSFLFSCRIYQNISPSDRATIFMLSQSKFFPIEQNFSCTTKKEPSSDDSSERRQPDLTGDQGVADPRLTTWLCRHNDPNEIRTRVTAVKGRCLNRLTMGLSNSTASTVSLLTSRKFRSRSSTSNHQ